MQRAAFLGCLKQKESHSLSQLYTPKTKRDLGDISTKIESPGLADYVSELKEVRKSFEDSGEAVQAVALQEVEQEREVAVEAETVRYVELILKFSSK